MPILSDVSESQPFSFDAASLITLLGVDEVNHAVGRLVLSRYLEFMPLLAPFVVTGNSFVQAIAGDRFYDFTNGATLETFPGWFSRYLISQDEHIMTTSSILRLEVLPEPRSTIFDTACALAVGSLFFGGLITLTILFHDWWGFISTMGVLASVIVRRFAVQANRNGLDHNIARWKERTRHLDLDKMVKAIFVDSKKRSLTVFLPRNMLGPLMLVDPISHFSKVYKGVRYIGWIGFIVNLIAVNQATFVVKWATFGSLIICTILYTWKLGCTDATWFWTRRERQKLAMPSAITTYIGSRLKLELTRWPPEFEFDRNSPEGSDGDRDSWKLIGRDRAARISSWERSRRRQDLYAWLDLESDEEVSMGKWDLLPHRRQNSDQWWSTYQQKKALIHGDETTQKFLRSQMEVVKRSSDPEPTAQTTSVIHAALPGLKTPTRTATIQAEEGEAKDSSS